MSFRWGVLGTASIAQTVVRAMGRSPGQRAQAVASRDEARARGWADELGIPDAYGSYQAMLDAGGFDAVYLPLPNSLHASWTLRALAAGYPVLCEKPLAMNAAEAREVEAASRRSGLPVAEGLMYRFHPVFDRALALLDSGVIGELVSMDSRFTFFEEDRDSVVASAALGGGALMDVGSYCVDFSRRVARAEPRRVASLRAGAPVDDVFMGIMEFPGGVMARFEAGIARCEDHRAEIHGTTGSIILPDPWIPEGDSPIIVRRWGAADEVSSIPRADTYGLELEDFARAVTENTRPRWPVADAVANMVAIDALVEASSGSPVAPTR